jgi:hypothetical protein
MRKYTIGYVDESDEDVRLFQRFADEDFEIKEFTPIPNLEELVSDILGSNIDALIVDYDLKEESPEIGYYGEAIIEKILSIKDGFPVFIFTSHDEEGEVTEQSSDVDIVIDKEDMSNNNKTKLLRRIRQKIDNYYKQIKNKEKRLFELLKKKNEDTLTDEEEDELIECDDFLEKTINKSHSIKEKVKAFYKDDVKDMIELLNKIDETVQKINHSHEKK